MVKDFVKCPVVEVGMDGCSVKCLLDTGAEVSTTTEEFLRNHLMPRGHAMKDITGCVSITAANSETGKFDSLRWKLQIGIH